MTEAELRALVLTLRNISVVAARSAELRSSNFRSSNFEP
jgi:hypothetical protein